MTLASLPRDMPDPPSFAQLMRWDDCRTLEAVAEYLEDNSSEAADDLLAGRFAQLLANAQAHAIDTLVDDWTEDQLNSEVA